MADGFEAYVVRLSGAGRETRDRSYYFDCRRRDDSPQVTMQLTLSGQGFYRGRDGRTLPLPAGCAWVDRIPGPFEYGTSAEAGVYEHVFLSMRGGAALAWRTAVHRRHGAVFRPAEGVLPLMQDLLRRVHEGRATDRIEVSGLLHLLMSRVLSAPPERDAETLAPALQLLARRALEPAFDVSKMAGELGVSREHLSRQLSRITGEAPARLILRHRLRHAARLLRAADDKLDVVARQSGFSGANYFCRVFRKHVGMTPAEYRRRTWVVYV